MFRGKASKGSVAARDLARDGALASGWLMKQGEGNKAFTPWLEREDSPYLKDLVVKIERKQSRMPKFLEIFLATAALTATAMATGVQSLMSPLLPRPQP